MKGRRWRYLDGVCVVLEPPPCVRENLKLFVLGAGPLVMLIVDYFSDVELHDDGIQE